MHDALGDRIKSNFENRTRYLLPRRTYNIIRLDGKAFHTLTKGFERPYDQRLMDAMDFASIELCKQAQGAVMAYTQSDEISVLLTDFERDTTEAWFNGNLQKIVSVSASIVTQVFNSHLGKPAHFDARVFTIPDPTEVENYFIWRQNDAVRNSISMTAQNLYSHKELHGVGVNQMQELCFQKGVNWNDMPDGFKRGRITLKENYLYDGAIRNQWVCYASPDFLKEREDLTAIIPKYN